MNRDLLTSSFDFHLPPERIAQFPVEPRDSARILHVRQDALFDHHIYNLPDLLKADDLLILNDTKVIPARLYGKRGDVKIEILLHKKEAPQVWRAFARPGKRLHKGDQIIFAAEFSAEILEKYESGEIGLRFSVADAELMPLLQAYGEPPLPPYIKRGAGEAKVDQARYQTIYAEHEGAIAAPTAGLHFTPRLLASLKAKNIQHVPVTLHVGAGTFLPVKQKHIKDHVMHAEWGEITNEAATAINRAKQAGRRIVAVGTTSLRLLESATTEGGVVEPYAKETSIFITPGFRFKAVDVLLTNFHLPQSTLYMLVCAFAGTDQMRAAYAHAVAQGYRFFSYGDATLLERST